MDKFVTWLEQPSTSDELARAVGLLELEPPTLTDLAASGMFQASDGETVIVESQFRDSDPLHLALMISRAADLKASHLIWIAETFRPEHLAALDYLNTKTISNLRFFAVSVELWKSGEETLIPKFDVLLVPLNWIKGPASSPVAVRSSVPKPELQRQFWEVLSRQLQRLAPHIRSQKNHFRESLKHPIGHTGFGLNTSFDPTRKSLSIRLSMPEHRTKEYYAKLLAQKLAIEERLGFGLDWQEPPGWPAYGVVATCLDACIEDRNRWDEYTGWTARRFLLMDKILRPIVTDL